MRTVTLRVIQFFSLAAAVIAFLHVYTLHVYANDTKAIANTAVGILIVSGFFLAERLVPSK